MKLSMFNKTKDIGISNDDCKWLILKLIPSTYHIHKYIWTYLDLDSILLSTRIWLKQKTSNSDIWFKPKKIFKLWFVPKLLVSSLEGTVGDSWAWHCDSRTSLTTSGRAGPRSPIHSTHPWGDLWPGLALISSCLHKEMVWKVFYLDLVPPPPSPDCRLALGWGWVRVPRLRPVIPLVGAEQEPGWWLVVWLAGRASNEGSRRLR